MAGQQFQYDDSGNTFFYFLTSFVGLIVIPATYYLWPRDQNAGESRRQLPVDPRRPHRLLRAAPLRPSPARRAQGDNARAAGPRVQASAARGARARWCFPGCLSGLLPPPLLSSSGVSLCSLSPIVLDVPCSRVLPLCLLCLGFYWYFSLWREQDGIARMGIGR